MISQVQLAAQVSEAPFGGRRAVRLTEAQKRGLRYQTRVEEELTKLLPGLVEPRPWFRYKMDWEEKRCQPDCLLRFSDRVCLIEIKYSTVASAWNQLVLYKSVVEKAFRLPTALVMVTRSFDPGIKFPCGITQLGGFEELHSWRGPDLGVVSWKPRGR